MKDQPSTRIVILGTTGSGKTTLAKAVSRRLHVPHVEMDALHWEPNWTPAAPEALRERVIEALSKGSWVVDGNYSMVRDLVWRDATLLVWLNYPFLVNARRLFVRTLVRGVKRQEIWNGNRESIRNAFFSKNSILLWLLQSYWKNRRKYMQLFSGDEYKHLNVLQFRSPKETERWLNSLPSRQEFSQPTNDKQPGDGNAKTQRTQRTTKKN